MISLIRIDDRLIHGQVMAVWVRLLHIDHILVVDDGVAADAFSQQVMQLAMPPSIRLSVSSIEPAVSLLKKAETDTSRTLVLLSSVNAAVQLHDHYPYLELNVGGIGMGPGRTQVWRSIAATPLEIQQLHELRRVGVNVYLQMIPSDEKRRLWQ